jgi:signal transduction histidine kinase
MADIVVQQEQLSATEDLLASAHSQLARQSAELRTTRARVAAVARTTRERFVLCDERGHIRYASPAARELAGDQSRPAPLTALSFVHRSDRARAERLFHTCALGDAPPRTRLAIEIPGTGVRLSLELLATRTISPRGHPRVWITARDVASRHRADALRQSPSAQVESEVRQRTLDLQRVHDETRALHPRLIDAERMSAAAQLAGSVAHTIMNPLAALAGTLELVVRSTPSPNEKLLQMVRLADRVREVAGRTLQMAREGTQGFVRSDPRALLEAVKEELADRCRATDVEIALDVEPGLRPIFADPVLLRRALAAVMENAIEASPRGGRIDIVTFGHDRLELIEIRVEDRGPGIPAQDRERVFEPFVTTRPSATGLGLTIARGIIYGHEGQIRLHERPGGGTSAVIRLPRQETRDARATEPGLSIA